MARHCMRPGCDRPAAARLTYDIEAAAVWLDRPVEDGEPAQQVCSIHAATLTAPLGWTVTDRRLVAVGSTEPTARYPAAGAEVSPFVESRRAATASEEPEPVTEANGHEHPAVSSTPAAVIEPECPEPESPEPEPPVREPSEKKVSGHEASQQPEQGSKSRGKLLDRAFEWTGPQHSVLTTGHGNRPRRRD